MKLPGLRLLFVLAAVVASAITLGTGDFWYLTFIAATAFAIIAVTQGENDNALILLLASGEILVIAVASASFFPGVLVQCAVIGAAFSSYMTDAQDPTLFVLFCLATIGGAVILDRSNQALLPFVAITALVAGVTFVIIGVQEMRERRMFRG